MLSFVDQLCFGVFVPSVLRYGHLVACTSLVLLDDPSYCNQGLKLYFRGPFYEADIQIASTANDVQVLILNVSSVEPLYSTGTDLRYEYCNSHGNE